MAEKNIVERLRLSAEHGVQDGQEEVVDELFNAAADEIERLRGVASEIEKLAETACGLDALNMWRECYRIARDGLATG